MDPAFFATCHKPLQRPLGYFRQCTLSEVVCGSSTCSPMGSEPTLRRTPELKHEQFGTERDRRSGAVELGLPPGSMHFNDSLIRIDEDGDLRAVGEVCADLILQIGKVIAR